MAAKREDVEFGDEGQSPIEAIAEKHLVQPWPVSETIGAEARGLIESGDGVYVTDAAGRRLIDGKAMTPIANGFLVEKMIAKPVAELIVGALRDPVAGPVLTVGAGGILVELMDDSAVITLPTTRDAIRKAIDGLKIARLLNGYRGQAKGDIAALVDAIAAAADFVIAHAAGIEELDINPLMVLPEGQGVVAADALVRMRK